MSRRRRLRDFADYEVAGSVSHRFRAARFRLFRGLIANLPAPVRIVDLGGTEHFWEVMGLTDPAAVEITLVNLVAEPSARANFASVTGTATAVHMLPSASFDVSFSNSVIEHVGGWQEQRSMAAEMTRLAPRFFLQTPNRWFPAEPHWQLPLMQFIPRAAQYHIALRFGSLGYADLDALEATALADCRLLTASELESLFPDATIARERFLGMTKSFMVHKGFRPRQDDSPLPAP